MRLVFLSSLFLLYSCVSYPREVNKVSIGGGADFQLISSSKFPPFSALQKVTVYWGSYELSFNVQLENNEEAFHIVGLTPVFSRSFLISYENGVLDYQEHPYFRYPVKPENMLADFQMAFAEAQYLVNRGTKIKVSEKNREFWYDGKLIVTIDYTKENQWKSVVTVRNHSNNYSLKIETLQFDNL